MCHDPIVEDIYRAREKILEQCNDDLTKWMERLKAAEAQHRDRLVSIDVVRERAQRKRSLHSTQRCG
jgi:hypothetical protein